MQYFGNYELGFDKEFLTKSYLYIPKENETISINPNPSNGTFELNIDIPSPSITIKIFSVDGRLVSEKHFTNVHNSITLKTELTSGVYNLYIPELKRNGKLIIK